MQIEHLEKIRENCNVGHRFYYYYVQLYLVMNKILHLLMS